MARQPITWETPYGKYVHSHFEGTRRGSFYRVDMWHDNKGGRPQREQARATGPNDFSRLHSESKDRYGFNCTCCYLNHPHTIDQHNEQEAAAAEQTR